MSLGGQLRYSHVISSFRIKVLGEVISNIMRNNMIACKRRCRVMRTSEDVMVGRVAKTTQKTRKITKNTLLVIGVEGPIVGLLIATTTTTTIVTPSATRPLIVVTTWLIVDPTRVAVTVVAGLGRELSKLLLRHALLRCWDKIRWLGHVLHNSGRGRYTRNTSKKCMARPYSQGEFGSQS
ncbi:hypothetical protein EV2_039296 [Malus domestica]